jgi:hypothetical protein
MKNTIKLNEDILNVLVRKVLDEQKREFETNTQTMSDVVRNGFVYD